MLYTSEITGRSYKTITELKAAEKEHKKMLEDLEREQKEADERAEEVKKAYEHFCDVYETAQKAIKEAEDEYKELKNKFVEKYGAYHLTYTNENGKRTIRFGK